MSIEQRVASRALEAARPIPVDTKQVDKLTKDLMTAIRHHWLRLFPLLDSDLPVSQVGLPKLQGWNHKASRDYEDVGVQGNKVKVPVYVTWDNKAKGRLLVSGGHYNSTRNHIVVTLNPGSTPTNFRRNSKKVASEISSILSHEFAHARDYIGGKVYDSETQRVQYFNSPHEVRAYMRQVADQALEYIKALDDGWSIGTSRSGPARHLIEEAMGKSESWNEVLYYLTPANERLIIKAVTRHIQDNWSDLQRLYPPDEEDEDDDYKPNNMPWLAKNAIEDRVARRFMAGRKVVDARTIEKLRKDFLVLVKNIPHITKSWQAGDSRPHEDMRVVNKNFYNAFHDIIFERLLKETKDVKGGEVFDIYMRESGWTLYMELASYPERPSSWRDLSAWDKRVRRKGQKFWKDAKTAMARFETKGQGSATVLEDDQLVMEGFRVTITKYEGSRDDHENLEAAKAALKKYRSDAQARMPWLIKNQLPLILDFKGGIKTAGRYLGKTIWMNADYIDSPTSMSKTLAHEMGHHRYKHLSAHAEKYWTTAIRQDYGPLDIQLVLDRWPAGSRSMYGVADAWAKKDPVFSLQMDVLGYHNQRFQDKEDFEAALARGETTVIVPSTPITAYAGTNPEEAFCEAIGMYVAYGPRALHQQVQRWLSVVLLGEVKTASLAERVAHLYLNQ